MMGVKTKTTLNEQKALFKKYSFIALEETTQGIIDTTYILKTKNTEYILKKYERNIENKINYESKLLKLLKLNSLNVSALVDKSNGWYLYEKIQGNTPKNINTIHIQSLARFLSKMHKVTFNKTAKHNFLDIYKLTKLLASLKTNFYHYYKKLSCIQNYKDSSDGIIHGDLFKDNTVFEGDKIGVFDFIDSGDGSFMFDVAVALVGFGIKEDDNYFINLFLNSYNQHAPKKLLKKELIGHINIASKFYALVRISEHNSTTKAQELLKTHKKKIQ